MELKDDCRREIINLGSKVVKLKGFEQLPTQLLMRVPPYKHANSKYLDKVIHALQSRLNTSSKEIMRTGPLVCAIQDSLHPISF